MTYTIHGHQTYDKTGGNETMVANQYQKNSVNGKESMLIDFRMTSTYDYSLYYNVTGKIYTDDTGFVNITALGDGARYYIDGYLFEGQLQLTGNAPAVLLISVDDAWGNFDQKFRVVLDIDGDGIYEYTGTYTPDTLGNSSDLPSNLPPTASIDTNSPLGNYIYLDGSLSSDPENSPLSYQWNLISKPNGSTANVYNSTVFPEETSFTADLPGEYTVQLTVTDFEGLSDSETTTINITD